MDYRPPVASSRLGARLVKEYGSSQHQLLDVPPVPPMMTEPQRAEARASRTLAAGRAGRTYWRSLESWPRPRVQGTSCTASSRQASELARPAAAALLKLMGASLALAGLERVHAPAARSDRPLRPAARGAGPGQAALLRDGDAVRRLGHGPARREPRGPSDEDRGQPRSPVEPRRDRRVRAGAILGLYDPDRSRTITHLGEIRLVGGPSRRRCGLLAGSSRRPQGRGCASSPRP